jgi:hypothetical protein
MSNKDKWGGRFMFLFMGTIFVIPIGYFLSWLICSFIFPNEKVLIGFALPLTSMATLVVVGEFWMIKGLWHMMINGEDESSGQDICELYARYVIRDSESGYYVMLYSSTTGGPKNYGTKFTKQGALDFISASDHKLNLVIEDAE